MIDEINKILRIKKSFGISANQALFLVAVKNGCYEIDLPAEEFTELCMNGYLKNNKLSGETIGKLEGLLTSVVVEDTIEKQAINAQRVVITEESGQLITRLAKHFVGERLTKKEWDKLKPYCKRNTLALPLIFMFFQMFPSKDETGDRNKHWDKHFGTVWNNVTLRRISQGVVNKLITIFKTKDAGLFLLGTYLSIKQSYNDEKEQYFVNNIENYMKNWKHWYDTADEMLESGELERQGIITKRKSNKSNNTTVI
jgi:hypothetical protein